MQTVLNAKFFFEGRLEELREIHFLFFRKFIKPCGDGESFFHGFVAPGSPYGRHDRYHKLRKSAMGSFYI